LVLIDEIIDLSKIEAQQLSLNKLDFSVDSLISELFQTFTMSQKNQNVRLLAETVYENKELFVFSDRVRVKQIFINLLTNAFKFTDFGFVEFGYLQSDEGELVLYVKDTGIGIQKEYHQAIFQRFRKLNEGKDKRIYRGTGLGLAITQKLVELLGGRIWVDSEPGVGSAFYFTLHSLELRDKKA
jgi:signal transduction histidine kinase